MASCQLRMMVSGSSTRMASRVARCSRKKESHIQNSAIGAGEHHFHQPAGLAVAVEGGGQREHMAEELRHGGEAVAMRQALGLHRQQDMGGDADKADGGPDGEQCRRAVDDDWLVMRVGAASAG